MLAISHFNIFDRGKCHARGRISLLLSAALSTTSHFGYFTSSSRSFCTHIFYLMRNLSV